MDDSEITLKYLLGKTDFSTSDLSEDFIIISNNMDYLKRTSKKKYQVLTGIQIKKILT